MSHVKRQLVFGWNGYFACQDTVSELAPVLVHQDLRDASELIDKTGDASVRGSHHRESRFDTAEDRIREMLLRSRGAQEPAVIGHVREQIRAAEDKLPRQVSNRIFETNQRRDPRLIIR